MLKLELVRFRRILRWEMRFGRQCKMKNGWYFMALLIKVMF